MTLLAPEPTEVLDAPVEPEVTPATMPGAPVVVDEAPNPGLTSACGMLSTAASAVLIGGLFTGLFPTLLGLFAAALGAGMVALSYRMVRPALLQWLVLPVLLLVGGVAASANAGTGSRNPLQMVQDALRAGGIEQPPIPFDPGWRILAVLLIGGFAAAVTMVSLSFSTPKLAVFGPVPMTFGALLLQPAEGGSIRTGAALSLLVLALVLSFGVDLGQQSEVSASFQLRRIVRGIIGLVVLLVALAGVTRLDFLFPPPQQQQVVPPQKPQLPPPEPDRRLFTVRSPLVLPWRLGTLDVYDGTDWLTPPFDKSRFQTVPVEGTVPSQQVTKPGKTVSVTFTLADMRDRVIPGLAGALSVRREDGFALTSDPRTQVLRMPNRLPYSQQTYTITAPAPVPATELRLSPSPGPEVAEFLRMPPAPAEVQAILDKAPTSNAYDRLQYVRAAFYRHVIAAGPGKPVSTPPSRAVSMLAGDPGSPYEITAVEVMLARWAGVPARFGYGYYDGDVLSDGLREIRPKHGATWLEAYFQGHGWVPLLGTPPRAQGNLGSTKNPNPTVRPAEDLALTVLIPVQQDSIRLFYELARYWAVRVLPWVLGLALLLWAYPMGLKAWRRVRRSRWAAARGPRERIAVAYVELRDLATDLNIGTPAMTPLEFTHEVAPDDDHLELAWLVTRAIWGDLMRDCQDEDAAAAEELARSLRRRLRGAQPTFNRMLAAVSRASLRNPANTQMPNTWWTRPRLDLRARLTSTRPATAMSVIVALLLLSGCAQQVPLQTGDLSGMPARVVPPRVGQLTFVREKSAERAFDQAGRKALVERGQVYTVHDGTNVQASIEIAPFKRGLLDAGRQRQLKASVLASLGTTNLQLKRIGDVTYRRQSLPDRTVLIYLPTDMTYLLLVTARPSFADADQVLGAVVDYQRGSDAVGRGATVAELPDPLRGIHS